MNNAVGPTAAFSFFALAADQHSRRARRGFARRGRVLDCLGGPGGEAGVPACSCLPPRGNPHVRLSADLEYFAALNAGRTRTACSLLGYKLRQETGATACPSVLALSRGTPFQIVGARAVPSGVVVFVKVGLHEFDHYRMLGWAALVGREAGQLADSRYPAHLTERRPGREICPPECKGPSRGPLRARDPRPRSR